ncbi:hypothetical protein ACX0HA_00015 [Flavobacterium hauense]
MIKKLLTYRFGFMLKAMFCLSLFLALGTTNVMAQFAISEDFRGSGNPDIIIGGPGGTEGTATLTSGLNDPLNAGWLRLTRAADYQKGYAYVNKSFPSTLGVLVDFEYKMWRDANDGNGGADGIGVFLFDATSTFKLGGYGGSLGYAPNTTAPAVTGLAGGYVGVGLDAYGNYSNTNEGRRGGPGETPNAVVLRGPTTTDALTTNRYLAGVALGDRSGTNNNIRARDEIDFNTWQATRPTDAQFYRRVQIEITRLDAADIYYNVKVRWKTSPTGNFINVVDYTTTDVPPALLKLGFAASTGASRNYHEIRNLLVTTPGNLRVVKRADKDILRTIAGSNEITYTIEVTNDTDFDIPGISFTDRITDSYGNLIPEGTTGFNVTEITPSGFLSAALPTAASLTTNEIIGNLVLAANTTGTITIKGNLYVLPDGSILQNMASAIPGLDEDLNNNTSTVRTPVTAEDVDLMLVKTVADQCINSGTPSTFTVRVFNNGIAGTSFRRLGYVGTRVAFSVVVPPGYTYNDITTGGLIGTPTDNANSNVTSRWSRVELLNTPSANYKTYVYIARGTDAGGAAQTLAAGSFYDYPVTYTMLPPVGTTIFTDTSRARLFTDVDYLGSIETAPNMVNNNASKTVYFKPPPPTVSSTSLSYCVDEDAPELIATKTNTSYTLRWYLTAGGFSSEYPIKPDTSVKGSYTYYVSQVNGDCEGPTSPIVVNVGPNDTGSISIAAINCPGNVTITGVAPTGSSTTPTYRWVRSADGINSTPISGATGNSYTAPGLTETTYFRRFTTVTYNGKTCEGPSNWERVYLPKPGVIGYSQAGCSTNNNFDPAFSSVEPGDVGTINGVTYTYRWQRSTNGGTTWTDITGTAGAAANYTADNVSATTQYRRLVRYNSNSCEAPSNIVVAYVSNNQTLFGGGTIGSNQTICYNATPAQITSSSAGLGNGFYQWEYSINGSAATGSQVWNVIADASPTSGNYSPGPLTQDTWYRRRKLACGDDQLATPVVRITVLNPLAGTITGTQTICYNGTATINGSAPTGATSYRWEVADGTNGGAWNAMTENTRNITVGPLTGTKRYRRYTIQNGCESVATTGVIVTVKAETNPGVIGSSQTICNSGPVAQLTGTAASGDTGTSGSITYRWEVSTTNAANSWGNVTPAATGASYTPPTPPGVRYYRRVAIVSRGITGESSCETPSNVITLTPQTSPSGGVINVASTRVCSGGSAVFGNQTPGGNFTSYQWQYSTVAGPSFNWIDIPNSNSATYTSFPLTQRTWFQRLAVNECSSSTSGDIGIDVTTVNPGSLGPDKTICNGTSPGELGSGAGTAAGSANTGTTVSYQWQSAPNASGGSFTNVASGGTLVTYTPPGNLTGTMRYRRITSRTDGTVTCTNSVDIMVTVQTIPERGSITGPATTTVCSGSNVTIASGGAGSGDAPVVTYRWEAAPVSTGIFATVAGQTGETLTVNGITASTRFRRYTVSTVNGVDCLSPATVPVTITVPDLVAGTIASDQVVCQNNSTPAPLTSALGGDGSGTNFSYQWQSSSHGNPSGSWNNVGTNSSTYNPGSLGVSLYFRRLVRSTTNGVPCEASSNIIRVIVTAPPSEGSLGNNNQPVCYGGTPTAITSNQNGSLTTPGGVLTYAWQSSTNGGGTWSGDIPGADGPTYTPPAPATQNTLYRRYAVATYGSNFCRSYSAAEGQIRIMPNASAGTIKTTGNATSLDICSGTIPPPILNDVSSTNANGGYVWQYSTATIPWTDLGPSTYNTTYTPTSAITVTTYYRRIGLSSADIICRGTDPSNVVTMNVVTSPAGGTAGNNQTICSGNTPTTLTVTGGVAGTYRWETRTSLSGTWATVTPAAAATGSDYSPGPLTQTTYYRRVTLAGACASDGYSTTVTITVTPSVVGGTASANQNICNGAPTTTLTVTGSSAGTYRWEVSSTNLANSWSPAGATTVDYNPGNLNATRYYRRVTISGSCEGISSVVTITVSAPTTAGSISGTQTICMDTVPPVILGSTAPADLGGGSGSIKYRWESSPNGSTGWATIPGAENSTYQPPLLHATRYYRRYTVSESTVGGIKATCESGSTGTVVVTTKNCKIITNPMVRSRVN